MAGACAGLRVLELSDGIAGSLAGMILADFGADVIRVERDDVTARADEPGGLLLHRGKRSIRLDLDRNEGREHLRRLVPALDALIDARGPREADDSDIGYEALAALN